MTFSYLRFHVGHVFALLSSGSLSTVPGHTHAGFSRSYLAQKKEVDPRAQLDGVVAGLANVTAYGTQVTATLSFFLDDEQSIPFSDAAIAANPFSAGGPNALLFLSASASVGK
jgi:hypothetical protein